MEFVQVIQYFMQVVYKFITFNSRFFLILRKIRKFLRGLLKIYAEGSIMQEFMRIPQGIFRTGN